MSDIVTKRLTDSDHARIAEHFFALDVEDRRLRFGTPIADSVLAEYLRRINLERDALYGTMTNDLTLAGVAHVARAGRHAELGVSVSAAHRRRGIGSALFERACAWARNRYIKMLFMHCLEENKAMMHIAVKSGMRIIISRGESDAHLKLAAADASTIASELMHDQLAIFDHALKSQSALGHRLRYAFEDFIGKLPKRTLAPEPQR